MAEFFLGQLKAFPYNFAPRGWAFCNGQTLPIAQNTALFSLLGTTYGGNGTTTFGLPDLRSSTAIGFGQGPGLDNYQLGETGGSAGISLIGMGGAVPLHTHTIQVSQGSKLNTDSRFAYIGAAPIYAAVTGNPDLQMSIETLAYSSESEEEENPGSMQGGLNLMQPYLVLNWCIATQGIFPTRN